jgi:hypothetical protein
MQNADVDDAEAAALRLHYRAEVYAAVTAQQEIGGLEAKPVSIERAWRVCHEP